MIFMVDLVRFPSNIHTKLCFVMTVILKKLSLFLLCLLIVSGPHRTLMTMSELCGTYQLFCRSLHSQEGATVPIQ